MKEGRGGRSGWEGERVTGRIKESSESRGRRPWRRRRTMPFWVAIWQEANEKVRATLVSLGCQPNPTDHLPGPLRDYFYACVSGNRSDPGDRPTPRDKIKGTRDKISRNAALSYRPSTVRSVPLTRPNFAPSFLPSRRSNIEKNHRSKILTGILFRFDRKVSLSNTREGIIALLLLSFDRKKIWKYR